MLNPISAQFGSFAFGALVVYLILRAVAINRDHALLARARQHALWCAVIGYFSSSSALPMHNLWTVSYYGGDKLPFLDALAATAAPAVWVGFVYIVGQFTWPRQLKPQRTASLTPRSLTGLVPKPLLWILALVSAASLMAIWWTRGVGRIEAIAPREIRGEDYVNTMPAIDGLRAGSEVAPWLAVAVAALLVATVAVALVIVRRTPLREISEHDNRLLRITWLNRLLRTVIVLMASTGGMALHYQAQWLRKQSGDVFDGIYAQGQQLDTYANLTVLAISIAMLFWRPPANFHAVGGGVRGAAAHPLLRAREQLFAVQYFTAGAAVVFCLILWNWLPQEDPLHLPTGEREGAVILLLTATVLLYLGLNALYLGYMWLKTKDVSLPDTRWRRLPIWVYTGAGVLTAASLYFLMFPPLDILFGFVAPNRWATLGLCLLIAAAHCGFTALARRVKLPWALNEEQEIWYRRVLELRSLRTGTAGIVGMLLVAYQFPAQMELVTLLVFFFPAVLVMARPAHRPATVSSHS